MYRFACCLLELRQPSTGEFYQPSLFPPRELYGNNMQALLTPLEIDSLLEFVENFPDHHDSIKDFSSSLGSGTWAGTIANTPEIVGSSRKRDKPSEDPFVEPENRVKRVKTCLTSADKLIEKGVINGISAPIYVEIVEDNLAREEAVASPILNVEACGQNNHHLLFLTPRKLWAIDKMYSNPICPNPIGFSHLRLNPIGFGQMGLESSQMQ
ncbi:hypothetical protein DFH09DRAFT_1100169 [Mycena vulgaris]|nr:hypothetical protein DFH09DRAFT_1100169 [Mycena vulgaris]